MPLSLPAHSASIDFSMERGVTAFPVKEIVNITYFSVCSVLCDRLTTGLPNARKEESVQGQILSVKFCLPGSFKPSQCAKFCF